MARRIEVVEIEAIYGFERHRFGDTAIISCRLPAPISAEKSDSTDPLFDFQDLALTIKATFEPGELSPGVSYRFFGQWSAYFNRRTKATERQFHATSQHAAIPHGHEGIVAYLRQAPHIGNAYAERLWSEFGPEAVRVLREDPAGAGARIGLAPSRAAEAAGWLKRESAQEDCQIELIGLLAGRGFPKSLPRKAVQEWGNRAAQFLRKNPYLLLRRGKFPGCGFKRCDAMYLDLGLPAAKLKRQALCVWHELSSDSEGHTWFPLAVATQALNNSIGGAAVRLPEALMLAKRGKLISTMRTDSAQGEVLVEEKGFLWLAEREKAEQEARLAKYVAASVRELDAALTRDWVTSQSYKQLTAPDHAKCTKCRRRLTAARVAILDGKPYGPDCITKMPGGEQAMQVDLDKWLEANAGRELVETTSARVVANRFVNAWPSAAEIGEISAHQQDRLAMATTSRFGILGGSPGTGKTYTVAAIVRRILARHGQDSIAVCAYTGKAAVRVTETMQTMGVTLQARTIHSLLGFMDGGGFRYGEKEKLPHRFIVIDEASMVDTAIFASLMAARGRGCHVLLVGDVNQLPPVGHGAPLRDLINAGLPYGELREIRRNSGTIVESCAAIRDGRQFQPVQKVDIEAGENLKCIEANNPQLQIARMLATIEAARNHGFDAIWDVQVVVPVNAKSAISRRELNRVLQERLNPAPGARPGEVFREGDKVINLKNKFFPMVEGDSRNGIRSGEVYVANGEMGCVETVEERYMVVVLSNPTRVIRVVKGKPSEEDDGDSGCTFDLGYAVSVHKSQGSEWPVVIVMIDEYPGAKFVCSREWIYTAISRAKKLCVLVGKLATAHSFCKRVAIGKRKTFLRELIRKELLLEQEPISPDPKPPTDDEIPGLD